MERFFYWWVGTSKDCSLHRACDGRLLKSDKCCIPKHSSWCLSFGLTNTIFDRSISLSCQYQNALQENHCIDNLSPWNGWLLGRMGVLDTRALLRCLSSPLKGLQSLWEASLPCHFLAAWRVITLCLRCWQYKDYQELFPLRGSFKTSSVGERQLFRI